MKNLKQVLDNAEVSKDAQEKIYSSVLHQLNNDLDAISGTLHCVFENDSTEEEKKQGLKSINERIEKLSKFFNDCKL
jgi:hypothetical protein